MEETNPKLKARINDREVMLDVKDIVKSDITNKEYIFYTIDNINDEENKIYVSSLIENGDTLLLEEEIDERDQELISKTCKEILGTDSE